MSENVKIHVWSVIFEGDDTSSSSPIVGATQEQAHDNTLKYLIEWFEEWLDEFNDCFVNWSEFTSVDDIVAVANQESHGFSKIAIEREVHKLKASDLVHC